MARTTQHTALDRAQREHMPRAAEMRGLCLRIEQHLHRVAALKGRDSRRRIIGINADGERRLVIVRVVLHHLPDLKFVETAAGDRRADQSARMRRHKIHVLRCERLGGDDDVALVLPVLIINDDEHLPISDILDCLCNRCKV